MDQYRMIFPIFYKMQLYFTGFNCILQDSIIFYRIQLYFTGFNYILQDSIVFYRIQLYFTGFNCSLFAYGQTGSGKSYSMVGYGVNK